MLVVLCASLRADERLFIPIARGGDGWRTELTLFNPYDTTLVVAVLSKGGTTSSVSLEPGQNRTIENAVAGRGGMTVAAVRAPVARVRVYRPSSGSDTPSQLTLDAIGDEMSVRARDGVELSGLFTGVPGAAAAIHLQELTGSEVTARVEVAGLDGGLLATRTFTLSPDETIEIPVESFRIPSLRDLRARVSIVEGEGDIIAVGSGRGTVTGDGYVIHPARPALHAIPSRRRAARPPAAGNVFRQGQLLLRLTMPIPSAERAGFLENRAVFESNGLTLAADGASITFQDSIPVGWIVKLGNNSALTDGQGRFRVEAPSDLVHGEIFHPQTSTALATFNVSQLGTTPIALNLPFNGPCNMNGAEGVQGCHPPDLKHGPSRTYPPTRRESNCGQFDGFLPTKTPLLQYLGSTCQKRVVQGCCSGEGGWGIDLLFKTICCVKNHRGRYCQELQPMDMEILGDSLRVVDLGETIPITVHNNDCKGESLIVYKNLAIGGALTGAGLEGDVVKHFDAAKLAAYDCEKNNPREGVAIWIGDRTLTYKSPKCTSASPGSEDLWMFNSLDSPPDGVKILKFRLKPDLLFRFVGGSTLFSANTSLQDGWRVSGPDTGCSGLHLHGNHPCSGAPDPNPPGCGHGRVERVAN